MRQVALHADAVRLGLVDRPPDHFCRMFEERLAAGPGTAFEALRRLYPQPQQ
jgi:hypothetical protein